MGSHYYEQGFRGFCTELLDPKLNLLVAIKILKTMKKRFNTNTVAELYACYNAGSIRLKENGDFQNQSNVDNFIKNYNKAFVKE